MRFYGTIFGIYLLLCFQGSLGQCLGNEMIISVVDSIEFAPIPLEKKIIAIKDLLAADHRRNSQDSIQAYILHRIGVHYSLLGDYEKGIEYYIKSISVNKLKKGSKSFLANSYYNLGLYHSYLSLFDKSEKYFDSCISIGRLFPCKTEIVLKAFYKKSFNYFNTGEYQKCINTSDQGITLASQSKSLLEGAFLTDKAQAQYALNKLPEALKNVTTGISILKTNSQGIEYLSSAYSIYANILEATGRAAEATDYFKKSLKINTDLSNWHQCTSDLVNLGFLYDHSLNDSKRAIACYEKAIAMLKKAPDTYWLAAVYNNLGLVYWRASEYKTALTYYQKGLNVLPISYSDTALHVNPTKTNLKLVSNNHFVYALLENKAEAWLALYKHSGNAAHLTYALNSFKAADLMVDQMRWKQFQETSKQFWREKTKKMYASAIEACYLLNDVENAFYFFEKSRAVLLNDKLSELGAAKVLSEKDVAYEQSLRIRLFSTQQAISQEGADSTKLNDLRSELYDMQDKLEKYIRSLEKKYPQYYKYKYDTTRQTIKEVQSTLAANNSSLVEYFTTDSMVYALMINKNEALLKRIPLADSITKEYISLCADPVLLNQNYIRFKLLSSQLYDNLVKPLVLKTKRISISLDDHFIPFESLLTDLNERNSFLLNNHIISYVYSASFLRKSNVEAALPNTMLGIAPIEFNPSLNLPSLHGSKKSLETIQSYFANNTSLIQEYATKKAFVASLTSFPVVHVYSHAHADDNDAEPVLYFQDAPMQLNELQLVQNNTTKLIVLSGCRTAVGKSIKGEGVFSLARGFSAIGIPSILTTLWSVDDKATYTIMELFYKNLHDGFASDEALQKAKLSFLEMQDGENELPYYWAAPVVIGDSVQLESSVLGNPMYRYYLVAGFIIIGLLFMLFRFRRSVFY